MRWLTATAVALPLFLLGCSGEAGNNAKSNSKNDAKNQSSQDNKGKPEAPKVPPVLTYFTIPG